MCFLEEPLLTPVFSIIPSPLVAYLMELQICLLSLSFPSPPLHSPPCSPPPLPPPPFCFLSWLFHSRFVFWGRFLWGSPGYSWTSNQSVFIPQHWDCRPESLLLLCPFMFFIYYFFFAFSSHCDTEEEGWACLLWLCRMYLRKKPSAPVLLSSQEVPWVLFRNYGNHNSRILKSKLIIG